MADHKLGGGGVCPRYYMITLRDTAERVLVIYCGLVELVEVMESAETCNGGPVCAYCWDSLDFVADQLRRAGIKYTLTE